MEGLPLLKPSSSPPQATPQELSSDRSPSTVATSLALIPHRRQTGRQRDPWSRSCRRDLALPVRAWQAGDQPVTATKPSLCPLPRAHSCNHLSVFCHES